MSIHIGVRQATTIRDPPDTHTHEAAEFQRASHWDDTCISASNIESWYIWLICIKTTTWTKIKCFMKCTFVISLFFPEFFISSLLTSLSLLSSPLLNKSPGKSFSLSRNPEMRYRLCQVKLLFMSKSLNQSEHYSCKLRHCAACSRNDKYERTCICASLTWGKLKCTYGFLVSHLVRTEFSSFRYCMLVSGSWLAPCAGTAATCRCCDVKLKTCALQKFLIIL